MVHQGEYNRSAAAHLAHRPTAQCVSVHHDHATCVVAQRHGHNAVIIRSHPRDQSGPIRVLQPKEQRATPLRRGHCFHDDTDPTICHIRHLPAHPYEHATQGAEGKLQTAQLLVQLRPRAGQIELLQLHHFHPVLGPVRSRRVSGHESPHLKSDVL